MLPYSTTGRKTIMSKTDITLWTSRIQNRKLSGLKVKDWCEQNNISRDTYYYWNSKLKAIKEEKENVFAEVLPAPTPKLPSDKVTKAELLITWKDFSISVTDQRVIPMVAELISRLEKQC